jgi:hypothetical protein
MECSCKFSVVAYDPQINVAGPDEEPRGCHNPHFLFRHKTR